MARKWSPSEALAAYKAAEAAGLAAGAAASPTPMIVGEAIGLSDEIDYSKRIHYVPEGACGFAWVYAPGGSSFVRALAKAGVKLSKNYPVGATVKWVGEFGQSIDRKEAYASAFAQSLRGAGVEQVYSQSRLD